LAGFFFAENLPAQSFYLIERSRKQLDAIGKSWNGAQLFSKSTIASTAFYCLQPSYVTFIAVVIRRILSVYPGSEFGIQKIPEAQTPGISIYLRTKIKLPT